MAANTDSQTKPFPLWEALWKLGAAVVAGVTVLGAITAFGGAVALVPLYRANIPVEAALAAKSKTELLTVGAMWLIIFVLIAAAILVCFLLARGRSGAHFPTQRDVHAGFVLCLVALGFTGWVFLEFPKADPTAIRPSPDAINSKTVNGTVDRGGRSTIWYFEYGRSKRYGKKTASKSAGFGTNKVDVSQMLTGLRPGKTYHYRLVATNSGGTTKGGDKTFKTASAPPGAVTGSATAPQHEEERRDSIKRRDSIISTAFWRNALFNWPFWAFVLAAIVAVSIAFLGNYFFPRVSRGQDFGWQDLLFWRDFSLARWLSWVALAGLIAIALVLTSVRQTWLTPELQTSTFWKDSLLNWVFWAFVLGALVAVWFTFSVGSYFSPPAETTTGENPDRPNPGSGDPNPGDSTASGSTDPKGPTPSRSFFWFAVALTVAIGIFLAAMAVAKAWRTPELQSLALLRKGEDEGLRGFYVAETSNFVHVALVKTCVGWPKGVRIMVVPRSEVVALAIGEKEKLCDAWGTSGKNLADLKTKRVDKAVGLPLDADPLGDGSISVPVGRVTYPDRLKIGDAVPLPQDPKGPPLPGDPKGVRGFPVRFDDACKRQPETAGFPRLALRITTVNTEKDKKHRKFVVSGAGIWVTTFPAGLFEVQTPKGKRLDRVGVKTGRRGFACMTLNPVSDTAFPIRLVLFVRAMDPKRNEMSVRRLMRVRMEPDGSTKTIGGGPSIAAAHDSD
jgi:hypothetical protein